MFRNSSHFSHGCTRKGEWAIEAAVLCAYFRNRATIRAGRCVCFHYATVPCRYGVVKQSYMQCLCGLPVMFPAVVIAPLRLVSFALARATGSA